MCCFFDKGTLASGWPGVTGIRYNKEHAERLVKLFPQLSKH